jgi:hypothetical protein
MHEASEIRKSAIVPQLFISEISQTPGKGFIFLKDETFLVTGVFRWDWMKKGNPFVIAPSPALPQFGEGCESSGVRELRLKKRLRFSRINPDKVSI